MPSTEPQAPASLDPREAFADSASAAADVQAAPELAEERDEEELSARARAGIQVDEETAALRDLPGVDPDTAGRLPGGSPAPGPGLRDGGDR